MKFLRSLLGLTRLDHQRNTTVSGKLKVEHIVDEIQSYQKNWLQHVTRMEHSRIPRMARVQTKMQTSCRLTKNKMEKSGARDRTQVSYICLCSWWWWWWRWLRNGCVSWNQVTPQMCQYTNIILGLKFIRNFHYEVLWEVSNRKCPRLYSNMIHTLWWYSDVNLRERVLIIGYVGHACWIYKPNNTRNLEHGLQSKHGP
jgi:hypothetical protein